MSRHNQRGYSLLELIIVISLMSVVAIPLIMFTSRGIASYEFMQLQSDTSTDLSILSQRMGKVIRGTTNVIDAQNNSLTIYGYFSPQDTIVKKIRYFINGTHLNIGVTPPTGTAPNYTYNVADEVVTTTRVDLAMGGQSMFTYYDDTGTILPNGFAVSQIKAIGLYVAANPDTTRLSVPISLTTRVTLRNFKTNL
ncbi:prepilin-type N-terminal cleavage/methylation domain-containing protein [bacterium]|nr:MAG: prepilin-type N-terminal cleavage/methylation domain-containing protein [bacterium]